MQDRVVQQPQSNINTISFKNDEMIVTQWYYNSNKDPWDDNIPSWLSYSPT